MTYQVFARKYRPQTFEEVIGQEHITRTLKNAAESGRVAHGYLFSGMRGVGKTTLARILAKALNCEKGPTSTPCNRCGNCTEISQGYSVDVIEIDGASNRSVEDIGELRTNVLYAAARTRYKIYIIDEVHMLSKHAFNALLKTLEEPPAHVIFVFATTEPSKVPITIQSRCQCFQFRRIPPQLIRDQLLRISEQERIALDPEAAQLIARASEGSMRDAQSLLDQVLSFCGDSISPAETRLVLGVIDQDILDQGMQALIEQDAQRALTLVETLHSRGFDLVEFCADLQTRLRDLLMIKVLNEPKAVVALSGEEIERLRPWAERVEEDRLLGLLEPLIRAQEGLRHSTHPRILLEMVLVQLTRVEPAREFKRILTELEAMEQRLQSGAMDSGPARRPGHAEPDTGSAEAPESGTPSVDKGAQAQAAPTASELDWEEMVEHANRIYPPVGSILEHGYLARREPGRLIIGFKKRIHYDVAQEKREKALEILRQVLNDDLTVEFSVQQNAGPAQQTAREKKQERTGKKREQLQRENVGNHVVQEALRIFKGRIVEVREFGVESQER